jgi:hypothetical protein
MDRRSILRRALAHQDGPVPVDFGSTAVTGMHVSVVEGLRRHYGLERRPVRVHEPYQMLGLIEDDLAAALALDTAAVLPPETLFGFPLTGWKPWRTPWGQEVLVPGGFTVDERPEGVFIFPRGDRAAPPSGHLPVGGYFFDTIIRQQPVVEERLDPSDNCEEFTAIGEAALAHFAAQATAAAATGRGVVATFGGTALGDIALVPAPFLARPKGIRSIDEWYVTTASRRDYVHAVFERQTEVALANLARIHAVVGERIDAVFVCGTDFGTQNGQFCSPRSFDQLWLPYYRRINGWIHERTGWKTFKHSCGAVVPLIDRFIDAGFDILNPVQCSAAGMEAAGLKARFGDRLVFWGGGVDTQRVLPFGTPDEVRAQVLERCATFAPGGGFVFDAVHNVQARTPIANVVAMIEAVREFNRGR